MKCISKQHISPSASSVLPKNNLLLRLPHAVKECTAKGELKGALTILGCALVPLVLYKVGISQNNTM